MTRRLAATVALLVGTATVVLAIANAVSEFPRGLVLLGCVVVSAASAWYAVLRRGVARVAGFTLAGLAFAGAVALLVADGSPLLDLLVVVGLLVTLAAARATLFVHVPLPAGSAPRQPVLFYNPHSGGGQGGALRARGRGPGARDRAVELAPGDDLEALVREAVAGGADALAMAGGDGSQAIVAAVAAEHDLPYACVPGGDPQPLRARPRSRS